jgi:dienelactone hydrolase
MGSFILITGLVLIAGFTIGSALTKSPLIRLKSLLRLGALAVFVVLTLAAVIQWSSRWYLLAVLLLVWAGLGVWALASRREEIREYNPRRSLLGAVGTWLLIAVAVTPALIFPQYRMPAVGGNLPVVTYNDTFVDQNRIDPFSKEGENRFVNIECWHPADTPGSFPLVVFSHGAFGIRASNTSTYIELASQGYVVCSIDHPHHSFFTRHPDGRTIRTDPTFMQEVMSANTGKYDDRTDWELVQKWLRLRADDIHFVLDTVHIRGNDRAAAPVYSLIDRERIGLLGHSLGAAAVAQVARERAGINAVVNLDTDLLGDYTGFVDGKPVQNEAVYPVPLLTIYTDDMIRVIARNEEQGVTIAGRRVTERSPNAFEVHLTGTNHFSLTDLPLVSPILVRMINSGAQVGGGDEADPVEVLEKMNEIVLQFFNVHLKGEAKPGSAVW